MIYKEKIMGTISLEDARSIANSFRILSSDLGSYRFNNWDNLNDNERTRIESMEFTLLNYSSDMTTMAIEIATDNIQQYVSQIKQATERLDGVLNRIQKTRAIISVATKAVTLAASIATGNLSAIKEASDGLIQELS